MANIKNKNQTDSIGSNNNSKDGKIKVEQKQMKPFYINKVHQFIKSVREYKTIMSSEKKEDESAHENLLVVNQFYKDYKGEGQAYNLTGED